MRKLLIALMFALIFTGVNYAQNSWDRSTALWVSDSLWNGYYIDTVGVDDTLSIAQASVEIPLDYQYEWLNLTVIDTGTTYDDSIKVEYPVYTFKKSSANPRQPLAVTDTVWQPVQFIRDTSWTNISNLLVDDNSVHSYQIYVANYPSIRVSMVNAELVDNRIFWFMAQANRKR